MLRSLKIQNYALIDHLEVELHRGLNTITGETGAGKSILLGAITLILGQRADTSALKDKSQSCIVEAEFDVGEYNLDDFFSNNDIDSEKNLTVRRIISAAGKSRAFINDSPVNVSVLKELGDTLIDIHSQHESLLLGNSQFQLKVLDAFAGNNEALSAYRLSFNEYRKIKLELQTIEGSLDAAKKDLDYLQHQLNELTAAALKGGELETLEQTQVQLTHAGEIRNALELCSQTLNSESDAVLERIKTIQTDLKRIARFYPNAAELDKRLESCRIELKDIANESEHQSARIEIDAETLAATSARIDLLYSLLQKHRLTSLDELIAMRDELAVRVNKIQLMDFDLETKRKELRIAKEKVEQESNAISKKRKQVAPRLEESIVNMLAQLGIMHASFKVDIQRASDFQPSGTDHITFFFSANKQVEPNELSKVASGGELSRLMLSLKSILAESTGLATIIFDEIDSGVSGNIADKMGDIIASMSSKMQVLNITHLPQIAAKGNTHLLVYKDNSTTKIKLLTPDERIEAIASMLSGEKLTDAAISNARELLKKN